MNSRTIVEMALLGLALCCWATPATAGDDDHEDHDLCDPASGAHDRAVQKFATLEATIESVQYGDDTEPIHELLEKLFELDCYALAEAEYGSRHLTTSKSALAYQRWWAMGGERWLRSYLAPTYRDPAFETRPEDWVMSVVIPPDFPEALTPESAPEHPLAPLFCPSDQPGCGRVAGRWLERARREFARRRVREGLEREPTRLRGATDWSATRRTWLKDCSEDEKPWRAGVDYQYWLSCVTANAPKGHQPPVGRFRAPNSGWLVIRGRRGHYDFCDEIRASNLETGAAYVVQSCSGLELRSDGSVDGDATDDGREIRTETGTLPKTPLRKAALFTFLSNHVGSQARVRAVEVPLPADLNRRAESSNRVMIGIGGATISSSQTRLAWSWIDSDGVRADGTLTWPDDDSAAQDYAADLIRRVEGQLDPGCAPSALPEHLGLGDAEPGVSPVDASASSLNEVEIQLRHKLNGLRDRTCSK